MLRSLGFWLTLNFSPLLAHAQSLQFDRFFPAAVSLGQPSVIKAEGKFPNWPVEIFCDRQDVKISCSEKIGELRVETAADSPPGCVWVRLANSHSASSLKPLLIESTPVQLEQEPNGAIREALAVSIPTTVFGRLEKNEDVDTVRFDVKQGQLVHARVIAKHILGSDMDAVLQLTDLNGNILKQSDDEVGTDPQLVFVASKNQTLVARIFAFPETPNSTIGFAGADSFLYAIRLSPTNVVDHFLPLLDYGKDLSIQAFAWQETNANDRALAKFAEATSLSPRIAYIPGQASWQWLPQFELSNFSSYRSFVEGDDLRAIPELPALFSGHIGTAKERDTFRFRATAGTKIRARCHSRQFGFPLDSVLTIIDPADQSEIAKNDDSNRSVYDASVDFSVKQDGVLELQISDSVDSGSLRHAYTVQVSTIQPSIELSIASDQFIVSPGQSVEVPVAILRQDGFDRQLSIAATGLAPEIKCEAVISEAKGESSKLVKLKLTADSACKPQHGVFQVIASETDGPQHLARFALRPTVLVDQFFLTVSEQK